MADQPLPDLLLVPASPLEPRLPDEHFAPEALAAKAVGATVGYIDHDAATDGDAMRAVRRVPSQGTAIYRGWMLASGKYEGLCSALRDRGVRMITGPNEYRIAHEFPGWYEEFIEWTPTSVSSEEPSVASGLAAIAEISAGPLVLRDFTKSMKHYWKEAAYIPDSRDVDRAASTIARFIELRGPELAGALVFRQFEDFVGPEVRTWWLDGKCFLITPHPDTPELQADPGPPVGELKANVRSLPCRFITVDFALRNDGVWRVVEVGDGQVSDRPSTVPAASLISYLMAPPDGASAAEV